MARKQFYQTCHWLACPKGLRTTQSLIENSLFILRFTMTRIPKKNKNNRFFASF